MWIEPYHLPPDKLAKALRLDVVYNFHDYATPVWTLIVLFVALQLRWFAWLRDRVEAVTARKWLQGLLFLPIFIAFLSLISLPMDIWGHYALVKYGLSVQPWPGWFGDQTKKLLLNIVISTPLCLVGFAIIRHAPRTWWLWFWLFMAPVNTFLTFLQPYVFAPMFDHFEPLAKSNPALVEKLEQVVARSGTSGEYL